ncbi:hypothetical protein [Blastococcus sp. SYSU DS1024]
MTEVQQEAGATAASAAEGAPPEGADGSHRAPAWSDPRRIFLLGGALVAVQLLVRGWVAASGYFGQDDLILMGRTASTSLSADFLLGAHERQVMPGGLLLTEALTSLAPLRWGAVVAGIVVLQLVASLAVWRLLRLLLGDRPVTLIALGLYLFAPLTLAAFSSWSTAVLTLPLHAALAWTCGDALQMARTGRLLHALTGTLAFAAGLAFTERSLVVPLVAFAVTAVVAGQSGSTAPVLTALRRGLWLWGGLLAVAVLWFWQFSSVAGPLVLSPDRAGSVATGVDAVGLGIFHGVLPGLLGGPLFWTENAWASPPTAVVVAAAVAALLVVALSSWRSRGAGVVWWLVAAYVVGTVVLLVLRQLNPAAPAELVLGLRDLSDIAVVVAVALALVVRAPAKDDGRHAVLDGTERRDIGVVALAVFLGATLWSTLTYTQQLDNTRTRDYLTTATESLAVLDVPLLDAAVPMDVVWPVAYPYNTVSRVFAPVGVPTAPTTPELLMLDGAGRLVAARVTDERELFLGPVPDCGHLVEGPARTAVPLNGPLMSLGWTVQLNYVASEDGEIDVSLDEGETVRVPVSAGANSVFVRLSGSGSSLHVTSRESDLAVCIDTGLVGLVEPDF